MFWAGGVPVWSVVVGVAVCGGGVAGVCGWASVGGMPEGSLILSLSLSLSLSFCLFFVLSLFIPCGARAPISGEQSGVSARLVPFLLLLRRHAGKVAKGAADSHASGCRIRIALRNLRQRLQKLENRP